MEKTLNKKKMSEDDLIEALVSTMKNKQYSKESAEIICTICNSEQAYNLGFDFIDSLNLAIEYVNKYDNEKDCINALIEIIK